jgi:hypothetical protein
MDFTYVPMPATPFSFLFADGMEPAELAATHPPDVRQVYIATEVRVLDTKGTVTIKTLGYPTRFKLRICDYFIRRGLSPDGVSMEASYQLINPLDLVYSKEQRLCADTLPKKKK